MQINIITSFVLLAIITLFVNVAANTKTEPTCLDPNGKPVDWFIALKHPRGTEYSYCDTNSCTTLKSENHELNDMQNSPLLRTLAQIENINNNSSLGSLFWNDQPPNQSASLSYAHAKGFMGFNDKKGFLMVHSTPLFPEIQQDRVNLNIPDSQTKFGQHFFCISTTTEELNQIAAGYNIDYPKVYAGQIPSSIKGVEALHDMLNQKRNKVNVQLSIPFKSLKGTQFIKFSKSGKYLVPFYENVLAEQLKTGFMVESWGSPQEEASCKAKYPVLSNLIVNQQNMEYKYTQDHSKYAVSTDPSKPYVCLGDINRQTSQWKRGGGTVCLNNKQVYSAFQKIMSQQQPCH